MNTRLEKVIRTALIVSMVAIISFLHFTTSTEKVYLHGIYQHIYYIPIILGAFWFGLKGGLLTSVTLTIIYMLHVQRDWGHHSSYSLTSYAEMVMYNIVGMVIGFLSQGERKHREKAEKTAIDLSEAYKRLQTTFDQLRQADRLAALGELTAGLAHEIRNPLGSIKGAIEILEGGFDKANPKYEFIGIIKSELDRLNKLVSEFIGFAKPPEPQLMDSDINEIIDSVVRLTGKKAEKQKVNITTDLDRTLPYILVDSEQIKQVLLNIVINGVQAMPEGGNLFVKTTQANGIVQVSIKDEGIGIAKEKVPRIFDPFFTTKENGTGLGLSISYQLVKKNGGEILVTPNPDQGLTFTIKFPIRR